MTQLSKSYIVIERSEIRIGRFISRLSPTDRNNGCDVRVAKPGGSGISWNAVQDGGEGERDLGPAVGRRAGGRRLASGFGEVKFERERWLHGSRLMDDLLKRIEPRLERLLLIYRIPPEAAEELLHLTFLAFRSRVDKLSNPEAWILGTFRRSCVMYWRTQRRRRLYLAAHVAILICLLAPWLPPES